MQMQHHINNIYTHFSTKNPAQNDIIITAPPPRSGNHSRSSSSRGSLNDTGATLSLVIRVINLYIPYSYSCRHNRTRVVASPLRIIHQLKCFHVNLPLTHDIFQFCTSRYLECRNYFTLLKKHLNVNLKYILILHIVKLHVNDDDADNG